MTKLLEGKVAIVTGSGQGIGRCIAIDLAKNGAKIITNNRKPGFSINAIEQTELDFTDEEKEELLKFSGDAQTTADEIVAMGGEAIPVFGDVSVKEDAKKLVAVAIEKWGRVDIIVNNASSNWIGNLTDMSTELWDIQISSKLSGSYYLMHYAIPYMIKQGYGRIFNSASDAFVGLSGYAAYGAGNGGVIVLTKAAALELESFGITVNAYTPLARTRSWYNARTNYRIHGIPVDIVEANAPEAMKQTAEGMVPFISYLASKKGANVSGKLFKLAANGEIGVWSDPVVVKEMIQEDGVWTIEELESRFDKELMGEK